jgi:hypothetical protein
MQVESTAGPHRNAARYGWLPSRPGRFGTDELRQFEHLGGA